MIVTTFPEWAWDVYAEKCLRSWIKAWPGSILVYYEGDAPPSRVPGVEFRPLDKILSRQVFLKYPTPEPTSFLRDVKRFCHKVFAQLDALHDNEQIWWLDADVELKETPPKWLMDELINRSFVTFLGRNSYTETGVIGFNQKHKDFMAFRWRYQKCYEVPCPKILELQYWTDCHAFDHSRNGMGYNMTPEGKGFDNVLEHSVLGPYLIHHKGPLKLKLERSAHAV